MEKSLGFSATKLPRPPGASGAAGAAGAAGGPGEVRRSVGSVGSVEAVGWRWGAGKKVFKAPEDTERKTLGWRMKDEDLMLADEVWRWEVLESAWEFAVRSSCFRFFAPTIGWETTKEWAKKKNYKEDVKQLFKAWICCAWMAAVATFTAKQALTDF